MEYSLFQSTQEKTYTNEVIVCDRNIVDCYSPTTFCVGNELKARNLIKIFSHKVLTHSRSHQTKRELTLRSLPVTVEDVKNVSPLLVVAISDYVER